jgi:hypothetical protein
LFLSFFNGVIFFSNVSSIKDCNRFDIVVGKYLEHFEDIVKEVVSFNVLIMLVCASVATFVEPTHDIDSSSLIVVGADVFFKDDWIQQS